MSDGGNTSHGSFYLRTKKNQYVKEKTLYVELSRLWRQEI